MGRSFLFIPRTIAFRAIPAFFFALAALVLSGGTALANPSPPWHSTTYTRMDLSLRNFFLALPMTIIVEFAVVRLLIGRLLDPQEVSTKKTFLGVSLINAITLPATWFLMGMIFTMYGTESLIPVLLVEVLVVVAEACFYSRIFSLHAEDVLLLSFFPNLFSFIIGFVFFSYTVTIPSPLTGW
jgi:hypothetical protein